MELKAYWSVIRRWLWMILTVTIVAAGTSAYVSEYVIKPTYQATTTILVNQQYNSQVALSVLAADLQANEALIQTYSDIMKSNNVLDTVINRLNLPQNAAQLAQKITVNSTNGSEVLSLSVSDHSVQRAAQIANTLASVFQTKIERLMQVKNVQIIDRATVPSHPIPVSPKKKVDVLIALVLGLMVSVGLAFFIEYLDDSVKTDEDIAQILGATVLGVIPVMDAPARKAASATNNVTTGAQA